MGGQGFSLFRSKRAQRTSHGLQNLAAVHCKLCHLICILLPRSLVRYLLEVKIVSAKNVPANDKQQFVAWRQCAFD